MSKSKKLILKVEELGGPYTTERWPDYVTYVGTWEANRQVRLSEISNLVLQDALIKLHKASPNRWAIWYGDGSSREGAFELCYR